MIKEWVRHLRFLVIFLSIVAVVGLGSIYFVNRITATEWKEFNTAFEAEIAEFRVSLLEAFQVLGVVDGKQDFLVPELKSPNIEWSWARAKDLDMGGSTKLTLKMPGTILIIKAVTEGGRRLEKVYRISELGELKEATTLSFSFDRVEKEFTMHP